MDIPKALELLNEYLGEVEHLRTLHYKNDERWLWKDKVNVVLEAAFGKDSDEYKKWNYIFPVAVELSDEGEQRDYLEDLQHYERMIKEILQKYEILGIEEKPIAKKEPHTKAFIAHGGNSPALRKLKSFLEALGVQPLVVEEQASEDRSVGQNVDWYSKQADCAIILATKGDIDVKTGHFIPRGNVLMEVGKLQELFRGRIIYLLQSGTKFPTNVSEKVWAHFSPQSMDNAFVKVARELKAFGILKVVKP